MLTVTSPSVVLSVPTTLVAVLPPLLRSATLRSTVSPASNNPFPSPLVPPRVSSSITGVRSASTGSVAGVIPIVVWNGRQLKEVTVSVVQRFPPSRGERDTNGSFWRACASPAVVTLSSYTSRKYSSSKYRPAAGKSNREDPTLVTAPPPGACRKASPIEGKSMAFEVQLEAYRLTRRLPLVSDSASSLLMLLSPQDMTLR